MGNSDSRQITRDSLFIMADLRVDGQEGDHRVKVRNLSAGGLMAEAPLRVVLGQKVWVGLRGAGWVEGAVAWIHGSRFGIAFHQDIDPKAVRGASGAPSLPEATLVHRRWAAPAPAPGAARKIL